MALIQTGDRNHQHFSASPGDKVVFTRPIMTVIITVPIGGSAAIDFDDSAEADGALPLQLVGGTHQFINIYAKSIRVSGSDSITGVGVST